MLTDQSNDGQGQQNLMYTDAEQRGKSGTWPGMLSINLKSIEG
jgi:hypothetical protein